MPSSVIRQSILIALALVVAASGLRADAQEVTYLGTVVALEAGRMHVRTVDVTTKRDDSVWFVIDRDTIVKRGDVVVSLADAKIAAGDRIAVIVDPAARVKMLAREIRLASMFEPRTAAPGGVQGSKPAPPSTADLHAGHPQATQQPMAGMPMDMAAEGWRLMQDGAVYGLFNRQGGPRGGREFVAPNWWMGMLVRERGGHQLSLNAMLSLDPATVGKDGYREIFQVGEALDGKPLIDRQHPHDFLMQLAASWRVTLGDRTALIVAGGPAGEPTLGPVAFMHRASAAGLVLAPLGHHTFDSTHIAYGVATAAVERGRWTVEASVFNGREPDQDRWDFDFGSMNSVAGRVWFRPNDTWEAQVSTGLLREPEELVPGDAKRTTASISWLRQQDTGLNALTFGYGVNAAHEERRHGFFAEGSIERGANSVSGRVEFQQVETEILLTGDIPDDPGHAATTATVGAMTVGAARRLLTWRGFEGAVGAHLTFYGVPTPLEASHGGHPVSFQAFLRVRLPSGHTGRMWNARMSQGHTMSASHAGHVMP